VLAGDSNRAIDMSKQAVDASRRDPIAALGMLAARAAGTPNGQSGTAFASPASAVWPHRALVTSVVGQRENQHSPYRVNRHPGLRHSDASMSSPIQDAQARCASPVALRELPAGAASPAALRELPTPVQACISSPMRDRASSLRTDEADTPSRFGMCSPSRVIQRDLQADAMSPMSPMQDWRSMGSPAARSINVDAQADLSSPVRTRHVRSEAATPLNAWPGESSPMCSMGAQMQPFNADAAADTRGVAHADLLSICGAMPGLGFAVQQPPAAQCHPQDPRRAASPASPLRRSPSRHLEISHGSPQHPQSPPWLLAQSPPRAMPVQDAPRHSAITQPTGHSSVANSIEVPVEVCESSGGAKDDLKYTNSSLMVTIHNLQGTVAQLSAEVKEHQFRNDELETRNTDHEKAIVDLQEVRTELESRLQSNGLQFLNTIENLEEKNRVLIDRLQRVELQRQWGEDMPSDTLQNTVQDFEVFQQDKEEEIQLVRIDANELRRQLVKQKVDFCQRLAEAEQERDNVVQIMTEESEELQTRISQLLHEKNNLLHLCAGKPSELNFASSTASANSQPGSGVISEASESLDCGIPPTCMGYLSMSPSPTVSGQTTPLQSCYGSGDSETSKHDVSRKEGKIGLLQCQVEIGQRKQQLSDMENSMLKNQIHVLRNSLTPDAEHLGLTSRLPA